MDAERRFDELEKETKKLHEESKKCVPANPPPRHALTRAQVL